MCSSDLITGTREVGAMAGVAAALKHVRPFNPVPSSGGCQRGHVSAPEPRTEPRWSSPTAQAPQQGIGPKPVREPGSGGEPRRDHADQRSSKPGGGVMPIQPSARFTTGTIASTKGMNTRRPALAGAAALSSTSSRSLPAWIRSHKIGRAHV